MFHLPKTVFLGTIAVVLGVFSCYFWLLLYSDFAEEQKNEHRTVPCEQKTNKMLLCICAVTAFGIITICSKSSPLYPLNDWVDSNCFFTVGKSMMNGLVCYRDILEQKGPLLYFVHGIAWMVSNTSFIGVWVIEIIACHFFLFYSYKALRTLSDSCSLCIVPAIALIVYTSNTFCHGDSAEELSLPFIAYAIWIGLRAVTSETEVSTKESFLIGIGSGCVFWIKFTLVGAYVGWFLALAICLIFRKRWNKLCQMIVAIGFGVIVSTIPFVIYFGLNNAIDDWFKVYLYNNLFLYSTGDSNSIIINVLRGVKFFATMDICVVMFNLMGCVWLFCKRKNKAAGLISIMFVFTAVFSFAGGRMYPYYVFIFGSFVPLGLLPFVRIIGTKDKSRMSVSFLVVCVLLAVLLTPNRYLMGVDKLDLPQYQFGEIIRQKKEPTILNYGFLDGGFYTVADVLPNCKAFCTLNIPLEEMYELQEQYIQNGLCDYIVTRDSMYDWEHYELVATSSYQFESAVRNYYLYELKSDI